MVPVDQEAWQNVMAGPISLKRLDHRGELTRTEIVDGGRTIHLTPDERRVNSERAASREQDVFHNGSMVPVRLLDGTEDAQEIASNPNLLSQSDMEEMLRSQWKAFEKRVSEIRNPATLQRLLAMANSDPDVAHRKVQVVEARLHEVAPSLYAEVTAPSTGPGGAAPPVRPVTPK